jgi:hypothetical protein
MTEDEDVLTTEQEPQKEPTKLDQFIEQLSKYPDVETAKTHLSEIAEKLHCARSLGYKALKKIQQFQPRESIETQAKEATIKITQPPEQPLEDQGEQEPLSEELPPEPETAKPAAAVGFKDTDMTWMFDKGFKMLADVSGYADFKLDPDDSKRLGEMWTPIINEYLPDILPYAPIAVASIMTIVIVVPKVKGWWTYREEKKKKPKPKEPPKEEPKPEPKPEPPKTETPPPLDKEVPAPERPMDAPFLKKL